MTDQLLLPMFQPQPRARTTPAPEVNPDVRIRSPKGGDLWCSANAVLFQTILAEPPGRAASHAHRDAYADAAEAARNLCVSRCPRHAECLEEALSGPPTSSFVAGTTPVERARLRRVLGMPTPAEVTDDLLPRRESDPVRIDMLERVIAANPEFTTQEIAWAVGCSPRTVKRFRKKAREDAAAAAAAAAEDAAAPAPVPSVTREAILLAFRQQVSS